MDSLKLQENINPDQDLFSEAKICRELYRCLDLSSDFDAVKEESKIEEDEEVEEVEEDEEFSFVAFGDNGSPVAAEDAFIDGQIKPVFPLFNRDLLLSVEDLPIKVPVDKVFVEMPERNRDHATSSSSNDEISGPYCDLASRKAVEVAPGEGCKKSNSTGFSKIWRFKELMGRSNSDGRDTFVFLNNVSEKKVEGKEEKMVNVSGKVKRVVKKEKTTTKAKTPLSAHEVYLRSKAREEERRRPSYLPYRPELMGFFTNANGGLSKNVHPY